MAHGPVIAGPLDGQRIDSPGECFVKDGERYLWLPILVDGKERTGVWRHEYISDGFAIDELVRGYRRGNDGSAQT